MDLSIIIVNWNTRELLAQCLESVDASQLSVGHTDRVRTGGHSHSIDCCPPAIEVIIVDNGSADKSADMVRERFPGMRLIENKDNVGFSRANNQAIRDSLGRYILLLNSDTVVQPGAFSLMVAFMDAHPEAAVVGGNISNADGTPQFCYGRFPSLSSETAFAWGLDTRLPFSPRINSQLRSRHESIETDWVVGAALMVRREVLDRVGLLDESYFMYSEEIDLAYRARRAGWKAYVLRDARIVHLGQQSSKQAPAAMKAQLFRSKLVYFQKHHSRKAAAVLGCVFTGSILAKCWVYRIQRKTELSLLWSETWKYFSANGHGFTSGNRGTVSTS